MELSRKLRVLGQTLSMHTTLRDRYARRALILDLLLLTSSVVFCASAFASDEALSHLGSTPSHVKYVIRVFSVIAFTLSVLSLRIDWKGKSTQHHDAAAKMARAIAIFRRHRQPSGIWEPHCETELDVAYWEAMHNSAPVPEATFVKLKARHLRKVELSRMLDSNPGCPVFVLQVMLWWSSLRRIENRAGAKNEDLQ
jgi:hypothetical protein